MMPQLRQWHFLTVGLGGTDLFGRALIAEDAATITAVMLP